MLDWIKNIFGWFRPKTIQTGTIEREFNTYPAVSRQMEQNINLWYALYTNHPPWESCEVRPVGIPAAIGRELARYALTEFSMTVSGGARGKFLDEQIQKDVQNFGNHLELGLCLGGIALKPYLENGNILIDASTLSAFKPTQFDSSGRAIAGVFKSRPERVGKEYFSLMEYHFFRPEDGVYVIQNKAFKSSENGDIGAEVPLQTVQKWADLIPEQMIAGLEKPLFAFFKPPVMNNIETDSDIGISVYGGATVDLLEQADRQWERLLWEYRSGERKIFCDARQLEHTQFNDRFFETGDFFNGKLGESLFEVFTPEFRDDPLYSGFQHIVQRIEFNVGLAYGTLSDPQTIERTATEILAAKNRQFSTEKLIMTAFESTLNDLLYAMNAWCDLAGLAPAGEYTVEYNWGDGVLDDPDTRHSEMAIDMQQVSAGLMNPYEYRMKWFGEDEETAKKMLPQMEDLVSDALPDNTRVPTRRAELSDTAV